MLGPALLSAVLMLSGGCSALLPSSKEDSVSPWHSYAQLKSAYDQIAVGHTPPELKELGFDIKGSSNLQILGYLDVAARVQGIPFQELEPGLQECLRERDNCRAYVFEYKRQKSKRMGNFWADFFNFRRKTEVNGWRFSGMLVLINGHVACKFWSGTPSVEAFREEHNPLGPLQSSGDKIITFIQ